MDSPESCENASIEDPDSKSMSDIVVSTVNDSKKDKLCLVCGDKALGYNFNAVSCESCKAFFRRNAHKTLRGRCEGKCNVNVESRSFCKRCRLAKCFTVGMRKEMILNDEQKEMRKQKIIFNKLRRQGQMPPQDTYSSSPRDLDPTSTVTCDSRPSRLGSLKLHGLHRKRENSISQGSSSPNLSPGGSKELLCPSWLETQEQVATVLSQLEERHRHMIEEVQFAMEESSFLATTSTALKTLPTNPTEFINVAECFVRKLIKVAKHISAFRTLNKDDQIALLKGAVVDILMLRSAVNYNPFTETWSLSTLECLMRRPSGDSEAGTSGEVGSPGPSSAANLSAELLKKGNPETRTLFMTYSKFIKSLMCNIRGDLIILKLLIMMSFFSADRSTLVERDKVQKVQEDYATALQAYAGLRFSEDHTLFARLVMKLTDLRNINEVHTQMLLRMKIDAIEPLLLEIFDLPV